jgi:O-antigen chain-terminating methyltransferase
MRPRSLKKFQLPQLLEEIETGSTNAETFNQIPLRTSGSKIRIERPIKKFLKWLIHWNTRGQVEFNKSVIRSLGLIAEDLETGQENFALLDDLPRDRQLFRQNIQNELRLAETSLRENLDRTMKETDRLQEQVSNCLTIMEAARVNLTKDVIRQDIQDEIRLVEARLREDLERNASDTARLNVQVNNYLSLLEEGRVDLRQLIEDSLKRHWELDRYIKLVLEESRNQNEILTAHASELKKELNHQLDEFRMKTLRLERLTRHGKWQPNPVAEISSEHLPDAQSEISDHLLNGNEQGASDLGTSSGNTFAPAFDYFLFEHQERGPASEIKRRQSIYLDEFRGKSNVVDLGCGRAEFVELLTENGIKVSGVDNSEDMAAFSRDRGLPVVQADIFEYLTSMPDEKFDGIFLSQVVEHFPPDEIVRLINLCAKKLQPGGVVVVETVNTNCPTALSNFYLDPTHVRPVPPDLLKFMIKQQGFEFQTFRFSSPVPDNDLAEFLDIDSGLAQEGNLYQDYAVIALRTEPGTLAALANQKDGAEL